MSDVILDKWNSEPSNPPLSKCSKNCGRKLYNSDSKRIGICRSCRGLNKRVIYGEGRDTNLTGNPEFAR